VVAMAPHVFIEPVGLASIAKTQETFEKTDLAAKFAKYHRDARKTFYGWADVWLDPNFVSWDIRDDWADVWLDPNFVSWDIRDDYLPRIECPVLAIQGENDEYGTMAQLDDTARRVKRCQLLKLAQCGHSPFKDQPEKVLSAIQAFVEHSG
jgi:pimeloyl-ACP methyl ester carboxylesterase